MVTLQTADKALKTFYLDAVTEQIDGKISPFLSMIEKSSAYVTGKGVTKVIRTGLGGGIAAGTEDGDLPTAKNNEYITLNATLKNLYGTIEITDKAIRASANSEGAFVNLLNDEMDGLIKSAKYNFSRMLFGNGSGKIGKFVSAVDNVATLTNVAGLQAGMKVDVYNANMSLAMYTDLIVTAVDKANSAITVNGVDWTNDSTMNGTVFVLSDVPANCELTGLDALFSNTAIYGVGRVYEVMKPYVKENVGEIDEAQIQKAVDAIEEQSGGKVNLILCSRGVRRALVQYCRAHQITLSTTAIGGNQAVLTFNGIPVVTDDYCPNGTMYLLNTDDFTLCQLCDWQWMEGEDGKILKQVAGKPVYTATLVKYAELLCERPCGQGMLAGITEA